jgi:hypothetical protein
MTTFFADQLKEMRIVVKSQKENPSLKRNATMADNLKAPPARPRLPQQPLLEKNGDGHIIKSLLFVSLLFMSNFGLAVFVDVVQFLLYHRKKCNDLSFCSF